MEGMIAQRIVKNTKERVERVAELLEKVGLPAESISRYPHEFSGGQRQRICIARALAVEPKIIVCDEPTSALDVSVQAQILNLLRQLQADFGLAYLFISHDISVVSYLADEVAVMYLGRIVEQGSTEKILNSPKHPYTKSLLSAVPTVDIDNNRQQIKLEGDLPSPIDPPVGCHYHPRCKEATQKCKQTYPNHTNLDNVHKVNCHLYE